MYSDDDDLIDLPNLLQLDVISSFDYMAKAAKVNNLPVLTIDFTSLGLNRREWVNFVIRNPSLRKITFRNDRMENSHLLGLIRGVSNLVETLFAIETDVEPDTVVEFFKQSPQLQSLQLQRTDKTLPDEKLKAITNRIENEWNIISNHIADRLQIVILLNVKITEANNCFFLDQLFIIHVLE